MKLSIQLFFLLALMAPYFSFAQDGEVVATNLANFWANKARQHRFVKNRQRAILRRRQLEQQRRTYIPPWYIYKTPDETGKKKLDVEDMQLWASMDLNKDGKLTVSEFERFSRSPYIQAFVKQMKGHEAVEKWMANVAVKAYKTRAARMAGANAARRRAYLNQQYIAQARARPSAIARRNQAIYAARQRQNYLARLGVNPHMQQQYYQAMKRSGGRSEL